MSFQSYSLRFSAGLLYSWKWKAFFGVLVTVCILRFFKNNFYENESVFVLGAREAFYSDVPLLKS